MILLFRLCKTYNSIYVFIFLSISFYRWVGKFFFNLVRYYFLLIFITLLKSYTKFSDVVPVENETRWIYHSWNLYVFPLPLGLFHSKKVKQNILMIEKRQKIEVGRDAFLFCFSSFFVFFYYKFYRLPDYEFKIMPCNVVIGELTFTINTHFQRCKETFISNCLLSLTSKFTSWYKNLFYTTIPLTFNL